jgi:hypothetical protein
MSRLWDRAVTLLVAAADLAEEDSMASTPQAGDAAARFLRFQLRPAFSPFRCNCYMRLLS